MSRVLASFGFLLIRELFYMDIPSKIIAVLLFAFPLVLLNTLESDLNKIDSDDAIALNAIESVLLVEQQNELAYFDDMDYSPIVDGHENNKYEISYNDIEYAASTISRYKQIVLSKAENNKSFGELHQDLCAKDKVVLHWQDGAVRKINYDQKQYIIAYGELGIREIKVRSDKGDVQYYLEHTEDDKIKTITTYRKSRQISKTEYEYTEASINITQENAEKSKHISYVLDHQAITKIEYRSSDKSIVNEMTEYIFNEENQLVRQVSSVPGKGVTTIYGFDYNENGQLLKSSRIDASVDSILNHTESLFAYEATPISEGNLCDQKINMIHSVYDEEGNLASVVTESKF